MTETRSYSVAVLGGASLLGRELVAVLRQRHFPLTQCRLFDTLEALAEADLDDTAELENVDDADFGDVDLVFLCGTVAQSQVWAPRVLDTPAQIIDLTQAFSDDDDIPLVVPEVNAKAVGALEAGHVLANPCTGAIALAVVLNPILLAAGLRRVVVAGYESVSSAGQEGIAELSQQTAGLLNGHEIESLLFAQRIAFNVIPQVGARLAGGMTQTEWEIESQLRRLWRQPEMSIAITSVRVPTFFGHGYAVNLQTETELDADAARALLRAEPGVLLVDETDAGDYPTLIDALEHEAVYVGRVRDDPSVDNGLNLWVTIDGIRKGAAVNAVQIAELWTKTIE